jgi:hypothetical protein
VSPYEALKVIAPAELGREAAAAWITAIEEMYADEETRLAALQKQLAQRTENKRRMEQEAESQRAWKEGRPQRPVTPPPAPVVATSAPAAPQPAPAVEPVTAQPEPELVKGSGSRVSEIRLILRSNPVPTLLGQSTTAAWIALVASAKADRTVHKGMRDLALMTGGNRSTTARDMKRLRELGAIGRPYAGRRTGEPGKRRAATYSVHPVTADLIQLIRERLEEAASSTSLQGRSE